MTTHEKYLDDLYLHLVKKDDVINIILKACPSFTETWIESANKELMHVIMGDLASHLLTLYKNKSNI